MIFLDCFALFADIERVQGQFRPKDKPCDKMKNHYGTQELGIRVMRDGTLRFCYDANDEMRFEVSLFCEIGEPFKEGFRALLSANGLNLAANPLELSARPYLADYLA